MINFDESYNQLNDEQRQAVDTIDGPLLVLAGPGAGKTQLLSARVANILKKTDALPSNILCLTFTESGVLAMRERLVSMIGPDAYSVTISTYHSFGSDIIKSYPEYFETLYVDRSDDVRLEKPIDELHQIQIMSEIINLLPFDSPLLGARYYVKDTVSTISELKQAALTPHDLRTQANTSLKQVEAAQPILDNVVNNVNGISRKKAEYKKQYDELLEQLSGQRGNLIEQATEELASAIQQAENDNSSKPLTLWKNTWLHKDENDQFTFTNRHTTEKMLALADVYEQYEQHLKKQGFYDFDDMILRTYEIMRSQPELLYNMQERYQYVLLDEFQDTNPAQFRLVKLIVSHEVNEGRPNIMAVGDDDQAIYAFQGAHVGNLNDFINSFRNVTIINLTKNYRSHPDIIHTAHQIAEQIEDRLHHHIDGIEKTLVASQNSLPEQATIERHEFSSQASEYGWVAKQIQQLIQDGVSPSEIAVLGPRHKLLEKLVPFLNNNSIAVSYEKRENVLETPLVNSLKLMAQLVLALQNKQTAQINEYFPIVLSLPFWQIPVETIWSINWELHKRLSQGHSSSWPELALQDVILREPVRFFLSLSEQERLMPLETTLDILTGNQDIPAGKSLLTSPLKTYYFSDNNRESNSLNYFEALSHLSVIRSKLRDYQASEDNKLSLNNFLQFFDMYEDAQASLINSHPIAQHESSVQLMTPYKAKGLEFEYVFLLSAHDDIWGSTAKANQNKLGLPMYLRSIRYSGSSEDELRRLLFVAITRAKHGLFITSHATKDSGKKTQPVKYLLESEGVAQVLPDKHQTIITNTEAMEETTEYIETLWVTRHTHLDVSLKSLLKPRLDTYRMSPTHLNTFIDTEYGGPQAFLLNTLLRFPQAPSVDGEYGTAIHNCLEWYQSQLNKNLFPEIDAVLRYFDRELKRRYIPDSELAHVTEKGRNTLKSYLKARSDMFRIPAKSEVNFFNEGVVIENALISGKIDRLEINEQKKTVAIVDYKTGAPFKTWKTSSEIKHIKYEQQLYFYKLLIEGSSTFRGYTVDSARLEFVEPSRTSNTILPPLYISFDTNKVDELKRLIAVVWQHIQQLDFPDSTSYEQTAKGSHAFMASLLGD